MDDGAGSSLREEIESGRVMMRQSKFAVAFVVLTGMGAFYLRTTMLDQRVASASEALTARIRGTEPPWAFRTIEGETVALTDIARPAILIFGSTDCRPCRRLLHHLSTMLADLPPSGSMPEVWLIGPHFSWEAGDALRSYTTIRRLQVLEPDWSLWELAQVAMPILISVDSTGVVQTGLTGFGRPIRAALAAMAY